MLWPQSPAPLWPWHPPSPGSPWRPLVLIRSRVLVILQLEELGEGGGGAREGEPRGLLDHVVRVAHVQLRHGHVDTRALGDGRVGKEEARVAELEVLELGVELHAVEGAPGAVQVLPSLVTCTQLHYCTTLHLLRTDFGVAHTCNKFSFGHTNFRHSLHIVGFHKPCWCSRRAAWR